MLKNNTASPAQYLMEQRMLEALPAMAMNRIPSPRILVTHARPDQLPSSVLRNGKRILTRNKKSALRYVRTVTF